MIFKCEKTKGVTLTKHKNKMRAGTNTNIKKGEIDKCDTKKAKIQRCDIEKVLFVACDILPAHTSRM